MTLKIIVSRKDSSCQQLVLEYLDKVQEILGRVVANVVHLIRWYWQTVFACCLFWCMLHDANYSLDNVIDIGKVAFAVAVVEDLYGLSLAELVRKSEVCHVGTSRRAIDREEPKACGRYVVELAVGVGHKFVALFCGGIKAHRIIHLVVGRIRDLFVGPVHRARRSIDQMLHLVVAAGLQYIVESDQIALHIGVRIGNAVMAKAMMLDESVNASTEYYFSSIKVSSEIDGVFELIK